jgi:hypothetical protein
MTSFNMSNAFLTDFGATASTRRTLCAGGYRDLQTGGKALRSDGCEVGGACFICLLAARNRAVLASRKGVSTHPAVAPSAAVLQRLFLVQLLQRTADSGQFHGDRVHSRSAEQMAVARQCPALS